MTGPRRTAPRTLHGHRRCTFCGYRIAGQPVFREEHYGLMLIRCPECGEIANPRDHRLLGGRAKLVAVGAAISWVVAVVVLWFSGTIVLHGLTLIASEGGSSDYGATLSTRFRAVRGDPFASSAQPTRGRPRITFAAWWRQQDQEAMLAAAGGWWGAVNWVWLIPLSFAVLAAFVLGCGWSVTLHRFRVFAALLVVIFTITTVGLLAHLVIRSASAMPFSWGAAAARAQLGPPIFITCIAMIAIAMLTGIRVGRPLARRAAALLLPPGLQRCATDLWVVDGKVPPWVNALHPDAGS